MQAGPVGSEKWSGRWEQLHFHCSLPSRLSLEQTLLGKRGWCWEGGCWGGQRNCEIALVGVGDCSKRLQVLLTKIRVWKGASLQGWGLTHLYWQPLRSCGVKVEGSIASGLD